MARKIAISTLNASTYDILNTIRANASSEYQELIPEVEQEIDIPAVGEVLYGYPALANQFISTLVNRIGFVRVQSATFNNPYARYKKGLLDFGETIEDVFTAIAKVRAFSVEKAEQREFKRTLPDVKTVFHTMNWRVQYPITIQAEDLRTAFLSLAGVQDLIAKIVDQVYTGAEYDEFLLFKYLVIKGIAQGKMHPVKVDTTDDDNVAIAFRGTSNQFTFMKNTFNEARVLTNTPKERQLILMDSQYNARFDVKVLAAAFNMEKADFMGALTLIDDFTTFDNERWDAIRSECEGMIPEVTPAELEMMQDVVAVLVDEEWFQVYDKLNQMTEKYVGSGMYWNYFYNVWKIVSTSPYANAVVFVKQTAESVISSPISVELTSVEESEFATTYVLVPTFENSVGINNLSYKFVQTETATEKGIAVHPYGAIIVPANVSVLASDLLLEVGGKTYASSDIANIRNKVIGGLIDFSA